MAEKQTFTYLRFKNLLENNNNIDSKLIDTILEDYLNSRTEAKYTVCTLARKIKKSSAEIKKEASKLENKSKDDEESEDEESEDEESEDEESEDDIVILSDDEEEEKKPKKGSKKSSEKPKKESKKKSEDSEKPKKESKKKSSEDKKDSEKIQCKANTKAGPRCSKPALKGCEFCAIHNKGQ